MPASCGFLEDGFPPGLYHRGDADDVYLLCDEGADRLDLILLLLLSISELKSDAQVLRGFLNGNCIGRAPFALSAQLGKTDN